MTESRRVQFAAIAISAPAVVLATVVLLAPARSFAEPMSANVGHPAITSSALGPVFLWCLGWPVVFARGPGASVARSAWALGCLLLLLHLAVAFHLGHGWSHEAAWEHTRRVGGYGDGIYVNYLFALVWLADAVWECAAFGTYRARPLWVKWVVFGFLAFIVFNAAVVFGGARARVIFGFVFSFSLVAYWPRTRAGNSDA